MHYLNNYIYRAAYTRMKAVLDLTMQDVLKLEATIHNMSDNEYIIHKDRIEGAMVLAR